MVCADPYLWGGGPLHCDSDHGRICAVGVPSGKELVTGDPAGRQEMHLLRGKQCGHTMANHPARQALPNELMRTRGEGGDVAKWREPCNH